MFLSTPLPEFCGNSLIYFEPYGQQFLALGSSLAKELDNPKRCGCFGVSERHRSHPGFKPHDYEVWKWSHVLIRKVSRFYQVNNCHSNVLAWKTSWKCETCQGQHGKRRGQLLLPVRVGNESCVLRTREYVSRFVHWPQNGVIRVRFDSTSGGHLGVILSGVSLQRLSESH